MDIIEATDEKSDGNDSSFTEHSLSFWNLFLWLQIKVDESQEVPEKDDNPLESLWLAKAAVQGRLTGVRPTELVRLDDQYA
jgi:hypothetical protein